MRRWTALRAPNCLGSSLSTIFGNNLRPISDSSNLLNVAVSEMGRRSSQMDRGGFDFGIGTTFALFQISGTNPLLTEALKIWHTGSGNGEGKFLQKPVRDFDLWVWTCDNELYTSSGSIMYSLGISVASGHDTSESGARSFDTCNNALLIKSASNWTSPPAVSLISDWNWGFTCWPFSCFVRRHQRSPSIRQW